MFKETIIKDFPKFASGSLFSRIAGLYQSPYCLKCDRPVFSGIHQLIQLSSRKHIHPQIIFQKFHKRIVIKLICLNIKAEQLKVITVQEIQCLLMSDLFKNGIKFLV